MVANTDSWNTAIMHQENEKLKKTLDQAIGLGTTYMAAYYALQKEVDAIKAVDQLHIADHWKNAYSELETSAKFFEKSRNEWLGHYQALRRVQDLHERFLFWDVVAMMFAGVFAGTILALLVPYYWVVGCMCAVGCAMILGYIYWASTGK